MKKKTIKKTAFAMGLVLVLGQVPITAYAVDETVNITGKNAHDISTAIASSLNLHNTVVVTGNAEVDERIVIVLQENKKVIWQAQCAAGDAMHSHGALIDLSKSDYAGDTAKFIIEEGAKLSHNKEHVNVLDDKGVDIDMTGGEIIIGDMSQRVGTNQDNRKGIDIEGTQTDFNMTGGSIVSYSDVPALSLIGGAKAKIDSTIKGLQRYAVSTEEDSVVKCSVNVSDCVEYGDNSAVIAFGLKYEYGLSHHLRVLEGSRRGIVLAGENSVYENAYWTKQGNKKIIKYAIRDTTFGEWDLSELPELEVYSFVGADTVLPTAREYNGEGYGVENLASFPGTGADAKIKYVGTGATHYDISEEKPVMPGRYSAFLDFVTGDTNYFGENESYAGYPLADFTITKRAATIKANSKSIIKGDALPVLDYTVERLLSTDTAFTGEPVLTTDALSGDVAGTYNINVDISGVIADEKYTLTAENATLTINEASQNGGSHATPSNPSVPNNGQSNPNRNNEQSRPNVPDNGQSNPNRNNEWSRPNVPDNGQSNPNRNNEWSRPNVPDNRQSNPNTNSGQRPPSVINPNGGSNQGNTGNNNGGTGNRGNSKRGSRRSGGGGGSSSSGSRSTRSVSRSASGSSTGNWFMDDKGWWFKNSDGSYPKSAWKQLSYNNSSDWYYFDSEGYMATGWREIAGKWYYLYEESANGHIKGAMAKDTVIGSYKVGSDGSWIK